MKSSLEAFLEEFSKNNIMGGSMSLQGEGHKQARAVGCCKKQINIFSRSQKGAVLIPLQQVKTLNAF